MWINLWVEVSFSHLAHTSYSQLVSFFKKRFMHICIRWARNNARVSEACGNAVNERADEYSYSYCYHTREYTALFHCRYCVFVFVLGLFLSSYLSTCLSYSFMSDPSSIYQYATKASANKLGIGKAISLFSWNYDDEKLFQGQLHENHLVNIKVVISLKMILCVCDSGKRTFQTERSNALSH